MSLKPSTKESKDMEVEVDTIVGNRDLTTLNYTKYVELVVNGEEVKWFAIICKKCGKPTYLHAKEDEECQAAVKLLKGWSTEYKSIMKKNESIQQEIEEIVAKLHLTIPKGKSNKEEGKFPLWDPTWGWEEYKVEIEIFDKGSTKKPITKFQDLIAALKESKKAAIAQSITDTYKNRCEDHNIIKEVVKFMSKNYGKTTSELIGDIVNQLRNINREKDEGMQEYIQRFDNLCMKVQDMRIGLSDRFKASLLKEAAGITLLQSDNINTLIDLGSDEDGLTEKMRQALRRVNISKVKEEAFLTEPGQYTQDPEYQEEEVLYGEYRGQGNRGQRGGYQQQGNYQQNQNWRGNTNRYRGYQGQGQGQPFNPMKTLYRLLNQMTAQQQQEAMSSLSKVYQMKTPQVTSAANINPQIPKIVFQVEDEEEQEETVMLTAEQVFLAHPVEISNILIDTGSSYNLIGEHLIPTLEQRMLEAGEKLQRLNSAKIFKFGGHKNTVSDSKVVIPLRLAGQTHKIEVHIVPSRVPFLIGGQILRELEAKIELGPNMMVINGRKVQLNLTKSGHMTIPWTTECHKSNKENKVLLTQKVSRKEYEDPEVMAAMIKEVNNLVDNGTYEEVKQENWMPVVDSLWVINRSTEDDGKNAGRLKARLVVRGDQDKGEDEVICDSPTVDRGTVKLMLAITANEGWEIRSIDISAAFLQGREIDREVFVRPPQEFRKPGVIWRLKKGLYGIKEGARLWYDKLSKTLLAAGGRKLTGDPACFVFHTNGKFSGYAMIHVDDIITGGTPEFLKMISNLLRTEFKISKEQSNKFSYIGMAIRTDGQNILMNQNQYIEDLDGVTEGIEDSYSEVKLKEVLKQVVGKLLYLNLSRPDIAFKVNLLARLGKDSDLKEKIKEARKLVKEIKSEKVEIKYSRLGNLSDLYLEVYADAAFGNLENRTKSTEGFIIMLRGIGSRCAPINWRSKTITRVCRSAKTAETFAMEDGTDTAICVGRQLNQIKTGVVSECPGKIIVCSDSKSLIESLKSTKQVEEAPMRMNIERLKDHRDHGDVTEFRWVPTEDMLADALTKLRVDPAILVKVLRTGKLKTL